MIAENRVHRNHSKNFNFNAAAVEFSNQNARIALLFESLSPNPLFSGETYLQIRPAWPQQRLLGHHDIAQGAGHIQTMSNLAQPTITHFGKSELPFNDPELMLHC